MRNDKMQGPRSCILIVEDKAIIAYCFERSLKVWARCRGVVPSGEEAIQKAIEGRPDLVLMGIEYALYLLSTVHQTQCAKSSFYRP